MTDHNHTIVPNDRGGFSIYDERDPDYPLGNYATAADAERAASRNCSSWGIGWAAVGCGVMALLLVAACQMGGAQ